MTDASKDVGARIINILKPPAHELVAAYYNPNGTFAGHTFETVGTNDAKVIGAGDLLALTLLDVAVAPRGVRLVLGNQQHELSQLLAEIPANLDLWNATDTDLAAAQRLFRKLDDLPGIGSVKAGKLLARKRPRLIPVIDKHVVAALQAPKGLYWATLRDGLAVNELWADVDEALRGDVSETAPTLRLLDVAIWMARSESTSARLVRQGLGLLVSRR